MPPTIGSPFFWLYFPAIGFLFGIWFWVVRHRERWTELIEVVRRDLPEAMRRVLPSPAMLPGADQLSAWRRDLHDGLSQARALERQAAEKEAALALQTLRREQARHTVGELHRDVGQLDRRVQTADSTLRTQQATLIELRQAHTEKDAFVLELERRVAATEERAREEETLLARRSTELHDRRENLSRAIALIAAAEQATTTLTAELHEVEREVDELDPAVEQLRARVGVAEEQAQAQIQELEHRLVAAEAARSEHSAALSLLTPAVQTNRERRTSQLAQLSSVQQAVITRKQELERLERRETELTVEAQSLHARAAQTQDETGPRRLTLEREVAAAETARQELEVTLAGRQRDLAEVRDLTLQQQRLLGESQHTLLAATERVQKQTRELERLEALLAERRGRIGQIHTKQQNLAVTYEQKGAAVIEAIELDEAALVSAHADLEELQVVTTQRQHELADAQQVLRLRETEVQRLRQVEEQLRPRLDELAQRRATTTGQAAALAQQVARLTTRRDGLASEVEQLARTRVDADRALTQRSAELTELTANRDRLRNTVRTEEPKLLELRQRRDVLSAHKARLEARTREESVRIEVLEQEESSLRAGQAEVTTLLAGDQGRLESLQRERAELDESRAVKWARAESLEADLNRARLEAKRRQETLAELSSRYERARRIEAERTADVQAELGNVTAELTRKQDAVAEHEARITALKATADDLRTQQRKIETVDLPRLQREIDTHRQDNIRQQQLLDQRLVELRGVRKEAEELTASTTAVDADIQQAEPVLIERSNTARTLLARVAARDQELAHLEQKLTESRQRATQLEIHIAAP